MLCLAVMLSVMVVGAGAAFSDQDKIENTEAVDACSALNIINGYEDGAFHPERNIKRAEVTKMICVALNGGEEPNTSTNAKPTFTDVRGTIYAWAEGYIESCYAQGIVDGVNGNRFAPASNVTAAQLAKMLLVSLGYNAKTEQFTGNAWETNVNVRAAQKHLYDGLEKMDTSAAVTRDQAAQMVWNAMQAYEVEYKDGVLQDKVVGSTNDKITLLRDRYDAWFYVGTLTSVDSTNMTISMTPADRAASDPKPEDKVDAVEFTKVGQDYSALMGQKVKVLFKNGKTNDVIGAYATDDNTVYAVPANGTEKDGDKVKFNGNSYSVELVNGGIKTYVDGQLSDPTTLAQLDANDLNPNLYTFVDTDDNNKLDTLIVKTYNVAQVTYAASDKIIANGKTYKTADENIAKDLKKDDWVVITENLYKDQKDIVKADVQTAKLDALRDNGNGSVHFDGKATQTNKSWNEYKIGDTWYKGGDKLVQSSLSENDLKTVKAGQSVNYVAVNGVMFSIEKSTGEDIGRVADVAMVVKKGTTGIDNEVELAFFDGTTDTVKVDKVYTENDGTVGTFSDLLEGVVYEYSVSGGKYSFEPLQFGEKFEEYYGDLTYLDGKSNSDIANGAVSGLKIDDDAQVLLYAGRDSKKISGKQFKKMPASKIQAGKIYAFSGDMNGLERIGALAVTVDDFDGIVKTWSNYGYIVTKPEKLDNNKTIQYTIWTKDGNLTVQEEKSSLSDRAKGTVIGFDSLVEKDGVNLIDDVDALVADSANSGAATITFTAIKDANDKTVQFAVKPVGATSTELDVAGTILYIDSDADDNMKIGLENGKIMEAQVEGGKYVANALVIGNGDDIELLIVDQGSSLLNSIYEGKQSGNDVVYGGDVNAKSITAGTFNKATVGKAYNETVNFTTKNIDDGKAVSVNVSSKIDGLTVTAANVADNKIAVTVSGTAKVDGILEFTVTADGVSSGTATVTVQQNTDGVIYENASQITNALVTSNDPVIVAGAIPTDGNIAVPAGKTLILNGYVGANLTVKGSGTVAVGENFSAEPGTAIAVPNLQVEKVMPSGTWTVSGKITATADSVTSDEANTLLNTANTEVKAVSDNLTVNVSGKTLTVTGDVNGKVVLSDGTVVVNGNIKDLAGTTSVASKSLTMKGDITEAVTLNASLLGNTEFTGKVSKDVTMPASGAVKVTFSGTVNTDNVKFNAANTDALVKFTGDGIKLGSTVVYATSSGAKISNVSDITGANNGFKYDASAVTDGSVAGWKAQS